jgi:membrane protein implicated in regulation of membrane protease activity
MTEAMSDATGWWVLAGVLVAAELATGTFYLLMLAVSAAAAALAAHAGLGLTAQLVVASAVALLGTSAWYLHRKRTRSKRTPAEADRNVNLDIGEAVEVGAWDGQGRAQVHYRGAQWQARFIGSGTPAPGPHRIRSLNGNQLELDTL